jgi:hypothetical protein
VAAAAPAAGKSTSLFPYRSPRVYALTRCPSIARHKTPVVSRSTENALGGRRAGRVAAADFHLRLALGLGEAAATHHSAVDAHSHDKWTSITAALLPARIAANTRRGSA